MKKALFVSAFLLGAISAFAGSEQWVLGQYVKNNCIDTGTAGAGLNIRSGPGTTFSAIGSVKNGEIIKSYENKDGWIRISPDEVQVTTESNVAPQQWVQNQYIKSGRVNTGSSKAGLNVRSRPDEHSSVVKSLKSGERVTVYAREGEWVRIAPVAKPVLAEIKVPAPVERPVKKVAKTAPTTPAAPGRWLLSHYIKDGLIDTGDSKSGVNVRSGPGIKHDPVGVVKYGEKVTIYATDGDWACISPMEADETLVQQEIVEQWVLGEYVKNGRIDTGSPQAGLNIRSGPGTDHDAVGALNYGDKVTEYDRQAGWIRISPNATDAEGTASMAMAALSAILLLLFTPSRNK